MGGPANLIGCPEPDRLEIRLDGPIDAKQMAASVSMSDAEVSAGVIECLGEGWTIVSVLANQTCDSVTGTLIVAKKGDEVVRLILKADGDCVICGNSSPPQSAVDAAAAALGANPADLRWSSWIGKHTQKPVGYVAFYETNGDVFAVNMRVDESGAVVLVPPVFRVMLARVFIPLESRKR